MATKKYGTGTLIGGTGNAMKAISGATKPATTTPSVGIPSAFQGLLSSGATADQIRNAINVNLPANLQNTPQETPRQQAVATPAQDAYANRGTPYTDLAKAYEESARNALAQQEASLAQQLATSKQGTKSSYDSNASQNYINYMRQRNALPEQLRAMGVNGGASETAQTRMMNNYAMNQGANEASRAAAIAQLQNSYDTNIANLRNALEERILDNNLALSQSQIQYDDTLAQRAAEEARYREEVERAARERAEDIARDEKWKQQEFDFTKEQYKKDQEWKQKEWTKLLRDQKLEQYAAGTEQYVTTSDIAKIKKKIEKIKKDKNWAKDRTKYGQVKALQARIGWIKQYNDNK